MRSFIYIWFTLIVVGTFNISHAQIVLLKGKIIDTNSKPLGYTTIRLNDGQQTTSSNDSGEFVFKLPPNVHEATLTILHVGKKPQQIHIAKKDLSTYKIIKLEDLSLTLEEVSITPTYQHTKNSNSSIFFDKETIQAAQAFSIQDVLMNLPGKETIAPELNKVSTLTLRGGNGINAGRGDIFNLNNSLGIAIIMDDVQMSNDANMQSRSVSRWGMSLSSLSGSRYSDSYLGTQAPSNYDVAFRGIDLREIPANNIESIEVVQGVASAKYGEITDGAIIINRQAGASPWAYNMQLNGGSVSTGLSKGFVLPKNFGAINLSTNYTYSNADPRDKIKSFKRINQTAMWTKHFHSNIKNTLSFDYNYRNDHRRIDPDDDREEMSLFKNKGFSIANRTAIQTNSRFLNMINFNINYASSDQSSYKQYILNRGITAIAIKDTIGTYRGYFSNGSYRAEEEIIGQPKTFSARLDASSYFNWGNSEHHLSYGASYNLSNNGGRGIISDPDRPRHLLDGGGNERAYDFEQLPSAQNWGLYIENSVKGSLGTKKYNANIGVRADIQNGYFTLQPRINTSLMWNDNWSSTAAFGISSKAPTLAHMFPAPVFIDIELLNVYAGDLSKALYLVHTDKKILDNDHLKPSLSSQMELGLQYKGDFVRSSFFTYYKHNWSGYETVSQPHLYTLPKYAYEVDPASGNISYYPTNETNNYFNFYGYEMTNGASSTSLGADWMLNFKQINAIKTTFSLINNIQFSSHKKTQPTRIEIENNRITLPDTTSLRYAVYSPDKGNYLQIMSKINSSTHIPKLGFIVNFSADIFWKERNRRKNNIFPYAYYNSAGDYFTMAEHPIASLDFNSLQLTSTDVISEGIPFVYTIINMSLVKEISNNFRINLNAYNLFNIRPEHYSITNNGTERILKYNRRPSFTIGTHIKF